MKVLYDTKAMGWHHEAKCHGCLSDVSIDPDDVVGRIDRFMDMECLELNWECPCCSASNLLRFRDVPSWVRAGAEARMPPLPPEKSAWERLREWWKA